MTTLLPRLAIVVAVLLAGLHGLGLMGHAYANYAEFRLGTPHHGRVIASARMASRLQPWNARKTALYGWILAENREPQADSVYRHALRLHPADPLLWTEYALSLARIGQFDALAVPTARAYELAPASPAIQSTLAEMAATYWKLTAEDVHDYWLRSIHYELRHNGREYLNTLRVRGQAIAFCEGPGQRIPAATWCRKASAG